MTVGSIGCQNKKNLDSKRITGFIVLIFLLAEIALKVSQISEDQS